MDALRPLLLVAATCLAGGMVGFIMLRNDWRKAYGAFIAAHVFAAIGLVAALQSRAQIDVMLYWVFLLVMVLPSLAGATIGGGIAWWLRQRRLR